MTRLLFIATITALFVLAFLSIFYIKDSYKLLPIQDSNMLLPPLYGEWREYKAPTGDFQVKLPTVPQRATQKVSDPNTDVTKDYDMYVAEQNNGTIYMISSIHFVNKKEPNEIVEKSIIKDLLDANPLNELKSMSVGHYRQYKTTLFTIANQETIIEGMTFMDKDTLYILSAIFHTVNYNPEAYKYFLQSFDLRKGIPNA